MVNKTQEIPKLDPLIPNRNSKIPKSQDHEEPQNISQFKEGNSTSRDKNFKNETPIESPDTNRTKIRRRKEEIFPTMPTQNQRRRRRMMSLARGTHAVRFVRKKESP